MGLHHISLGVTNVRRSKAFYDAALECLGLVAVAPVEMPGAGLVGVGYGAKGGAPTFWIQAPINRQGPSVGNGTHVAFAAPSRAAVDSFYMAALAQGGADDGQPGLRTEYAPEYYAAFVRDPDGHKIEAVALTE